MRPALLFPFALACAAPAPETPPGGTPATVAAAAADTAAAREARAESPPPTGARALGFLTWEDLGIRLIGSGETAGLRIDVTTLQDEAVALASDDMRAYFADVKGRIPAAVPAEAARELHPFLVGFTGNQKEVSFDPTRLQVLSEGSTYYPRYVVPVSPGFDRRLVDLYQTVYAVYLFESELDLLSTIEFQYGNLSSGTRWRDVVEKIQRAKTQRRSDTSS